jgi:hypothetical protein
MKHLIFTSLSGLPYSVVPRQQLKSPNEAFTMDFSNIGNTYLCFEIKSYKTSKLGLELKRQQLLNDFTVLTQPPHLTKTGNQFGVK